MPNAEKLEKKQKYFEKLIDLCVNSPQALLVGIDHVGSKQMQDIRMELRGRAVVVMGKNTMIRKAMQIGHERHPDAGMDNIRFNTYGNMGFIFAVACTLDDIRDTLSKYRVPAAAKAMQVSMVDTAIPAGPTGMDPSQTSFFQALNIGTKIVKGQIELVSEFAILKKGEKVSPSAAVLLGKLGIKPFEYGMEVQQVFTGGKVFSVEVLDMKDEVIIAKFLQGASNMAAFGRELGVPNDCSLPFSMRNGFKNVAALVSDLDFCFKEVEDVKKFMENPDAFVAAAAPAAAAAAPAAAGGKAEAKKAVVEEEEEEDMDFDLFG